MGGKSTYSDDGSRLIPRTPTSFRSMWLHGGVEMSGESVVLELSRVLTVEELLFEVVWYHNMALSTYVTL